MEMENRLALASEATTFLQPAEGRVSWGISGEK